MLNEESKNVTPITQKIQQPTQNPKLSEYLQLVAQIGETQVRIELDTEALPIMKAKAKALIEELKTTVVPNGN